MEAISLKAAAIACIVVWAAAIAMCRNSKVDLSDLPAGSLFEAEVPVNWLVTGRKDSGRCQCLGISSGGQGYEIWLPEEEALIGIAIIVGNGLHQPDGEGGMHLLREEEARAEALEWPINDAVGRIQAGAQVTCIRHILLVALNDVRDGERRCKHFHCEDRSVEEWLSLKQKVTPRRQQTDARRA